MAGENPATAVLNQFATAALMLNGLVDLSEDNK